MIAISNCSNARTPGSANVALAKLSAIGCRDELLNVSLSSAECRPTEQSGDIITIKHKYVD